VPAIHDVAQTSVCGFSDEASHLAEGRPRRAAARGRLEARSYVCSDEGTAVSRTAKSHRLKSVLLKRMSVESCGFSVDDVRAIAREDAA
jgi:hypothetical protein